MKVLYILPTGLFIEGISAIVLNYFHNIDENKISIDFVVPFVIPSIEKAIKDKGRKIYLIQGRKKNPFKYIKELTRVIKEGEYDAVHAHGSSAMICIEMIAAKRAGCKIRIAHSHNTKTDHKVLDKILRPILYKTYTNGFACGKEAGKWLFKKRKFEIINNGKNIEDYEYNSKIRQEVRKKYNLSEKIVIGHVGGFNYQKNHEYLLDIFYQLNAINKNKYALILIGDGKLRLQIEEKAKRLGIFDNIIFTGNTSKVSEWLQAMDIMVLPSRFEGFPNVVVEWQLSGLPCLISDKITKDVKLTRLVEFASIDVEPKKWAKKIEKIKSEDRESSKKEIYKDIKEKGFDIKENAKKLERIYMQLYKGVN